MIRTSTAALTTLGLFAATPALAIDDPYMWGVGPRIGTTVIPGQYPVTFPTKLVNYNFIDDDSPEAGDTKSDDPKRDLDENDDPLAHGLSKVQLDVNMGGDFVFYFDKQYRLGALTGITLGKQFFDINLLPKFDYVLLEDQIDVFVGGGLGFGFMKFAGNEGAESLRVPYYPVRAHVGAIARSDTIGYQLTVYAQSNVPGNQVYTTPDGVEHTNIGTPLAFTSYLAAGLEFSLLIGDFKPPKKKKGGKKGGGKKGGGKKK